MKHRTSHLAWILTFAFSWLSLPAFAQEVAPVSGEELSLPTYPPIENFAEISERPLFHTTRRPKPKSETAAPLDDSNVQEEWRLVGVIVREESPLALLAEQKSDKKVTLSVGMPLDRTWVLSEVGTDYVLLEGNNNEARLELWQPRDRTPVARQTNEQRARQQQQNTEGSAANARAQREQRAQPTQNRAVRPSNNRTNGG